MSNSAENMKKNVIWNTVGSIYYSMCQWVMTVIIVYLTPDYVTIGILGLAMTVTNSFTTISSFGMRSFQISDINKKYSDEEYIMSRRITAFVAFVACAVYSIAIKCSTTELVCVLLYMGLRLVESGSDVFQGVFQKNDRYDYIGISNILRGTLQIASFVGVFMVTQDLAIAFLVMFISNLLVLIFFDKRFVKKVTDLGKIAWSQNIIKLYGECFMLVIYHFAVNSLATIVRVAVRELCGADMLGIYSTVSSPTVIISLLGSVVFSPFIPVFARMYNNRQKTEFRKYILKIIIIMAAAFVAVNIGGVVLGRWGLNLIYGAKIAEYVALLLPLIWCTFFAAALWLFAGTLIAMRKIKCLVIAAVVAFCLNYVLSRPFINLFGVNGASYCLTLVEALLMVFFMIMVLFEIGKLKEGE